MSVIVEQIVAVHRSLAEAGLPHAFGGALALAWCTESPRGTIDIDLNVFVDHGRANEVLAVLPPEVSRDDSDLLLLERDGQARLWWGDTPVDLFLDTTEFHREAGLRVREQPFAGHEVPFLSCTDLAVFKAFYDRTKDWADIEAMWEVGSLDLDRVVGVLSRYLGPRDPRINRLLSLPGADRRSARRSARD